MEEPNKMSTEAHKSWEFKKSEIPLMNVTYWLTNHTIHIYHLESRWRNSQKVAYLGAMINQYMGVAPSTFTTVYEQSYHPMNGYPPGNTKYPIPRPFWRWCSFPVWWDMLLPCMVYLPPRIVWFCLVQINGPVPPDSGDLEQGHQCRSALTNMLCPPKKKLMQLKGMNKF